MPFKKSINFSENDLLDDEIAAQLQILNEEQEFNDKRQKIETAN